MPKIKADPKKSIEFLEWLRPEGPWVLSSIVPGGRITTSTFKVEQKELLHSWLQSRAGLENVYFQVNSSGDNLLTTKAKKINIERAEWLHVDVDPSADPTLFEAERKRILERLKSHRPHPSLIIDSGGGYQAFWRLSDPQPAGEDWSEFERYNRQIEEELGGDHCHNVDRIMRLPGTINVPNKKKAAAGRAPALSKVVHQDDKTFELSVFSQAPMIDGGEQGDVGRPDVNLSGNLPRLNEVDDLDEHGEVSQQVKMLIVQGLDPDNPGKWPSRSECFWHVVCSMVRAEIPDDVIGSVILDPDFLISAHVLDQKNPQGYAVRQIQRAKEHSIHPELVELNDKHFMTILGGKARIGTESYHEKRGREITYSAADSFRTYYSNRRVVVGENDKGTPITVPMGKWWIEHPQRRSYEGVVFDPSEQAPPNHYNLWRGFACPAVSGDLHQGWLDHLRDIICNGVQEHYDYLINWCARIVQQPATQSETTIVLRGKEGTGKNTFVEGLGDLFPEHFFETTSANHITGNFNAHLRDKILVHANEAFFAGDKRQEAALKGLITDPRMAIEAKGVDASQEPNYIHLVMSSNSEWVVPAGPDSRRFFVLDVSEKRMRDGVYFGKLKRDLANGGRSHLLRHLLDMDLSNFDVRAVPTTEALIEQRIKTMSKMAQWWMSRLERGYIVNPDEGWAAEVEVEHVWKSYVTEMQEQAENYRGTRIEVGQFLGRLCPNLGKRRVQRGNRKTYLYQLPDLDTCRSSFDDLMGGPFKWGELDLEIQSEVPF